MKKFQSSFNEGSELDYYNSIIIEKYLLHKHILLFCKIFVANSIKCLDNIVDFVALIY